MNNIYIILSILLIYIVLCINTTYPTDNKKLSKTQNNILLITNVYGYLLGIFILVYETNYMYINYNHDMSIRVVELFIILFILCLGIYANIFQDNVNSGLGKISSGINPLLSSLFIILIFCLNTVITYYKKKEDIIYKRFDEFSGLII